MIANLIHHIRGHAVAYLALFLALGGTSFAASRLPADSVGPEQMIPGAAADDVFKQPGNLPELGSGKTLRGNYSAGGAGTGGSDDYATDSISFVFTLKSAPTPHYVKYGQSPPAQCPGTLASPQAQPGHLCVYESEPTANAQTQSIGDPVSGNVAQANRYGAIVNVWGADQSLFAVSGTWAVTSP